MLTRQPSVVTLANERVPILWVCRAIGMDVPDEFLRPTKIRCPFGLVYHSDQGQAPAFRVYPDSNTAHCFAKCGHFSPVWLAATAWDRPPVEVAKDLLDQIGYQPLSLAQLWAQAVTRERPPDTTLLGLALRAYCTRLDSHWSTRQYEPSIATSLDKCLALLGRVHDEQGASQWLACGKIVMKRALCPS